MLAGVRLADPQLRVLAASPVDRQDDLTCSLVDIGNNVGDQSAQEPLARAHCHTQRVPCGVEILRQTSEVRQRNGRVWRAHRLQPCFTLLYSAKCRLPTLLKLRGDQAIVGIAGSVAPFRERSFVASLL